MGVKRYMMGKTLNEAVGIMLSKMEVNVPVPEAVGTISLRIWVTVQ